MLFLSITDLFIEIRSCMRQSITLCLMALVISGCESVYVARYLEAQYCPRALVLKGAELARGKIAAELAPLEISCDIDWQGEVGQKSFQIGALSVDIVVRGKLTEPDQARLPLFLVMMHEADRRIIRRAHFAVEAEAGEWFSHTVQQKLAGRQAERGSEYIFLIGFDLPSAGLTNLSKKR